MLQLGLHRDDCLDNNGFNFIPNLRGRPCRSRLPFTRRWLRHDTLETVIQPQLVSIIVKVVILLV